MVDAGFILQIDCPDLGSCRHNQYRHLSDTEFRRIAQRNIAALNAATEGLPPDRMRLHICWGNYEGPHTHDIALKDIIDIALKARPQGLSIEAANPRHEHEWEDLAAIQIPDDKVLIPGVLNSTTNFVEHPRLIAQRIGRFADIVGREQVIAGSDCGLAPRRPHPRSSRPASSWPSSRRSLKARASLANGSGDRNGRSLSQQIGVTLFRKPSRRFCFRLVSLTANAARNRYEKRRTAFGAKRKH